MDQDVWIRVLPDGVVRMGMTDPAQTRAGKILHVRVRTGKRLLPGQSLATVESGKWVGPVPTPLAGVVGAGNPRIADDPGLINRDPYGLGWVAEFRPEAAIDAWSAAGLMYGPEALDAYHEKLQAENLSCVRCADPAP